MNTRDEPHADAQKYRRLHVIAGDANLSEVATFLKLGTTAIVLAMLEDGDAGEPLTFALPVPAMHQVSRDLGLQEPLTMADGTSMTALEIQWELHARARDWADRRGTESVGGPEVAAMILQRWEEVLDGLSADPLGLSDQLDWVAKYRLFDAYRERHGIEWSDARLRAMDLQYHDMRPDSGLAARVGLDTLVDPDQVDSAISQPPESTRAYFRGRCLERFPEQIVAANWDSIVFDVGGSSLHRVPMMEPTRGSAEHVRDLIEGSDSAEVLLERLGR